MNVIKKAWKFLLRHKIITLSVFFLVIAGVYGVLSWQFWKNFQTAYEGAYAQLRGDVDHALALPSDSAEEKTKKVAALHEIAALPDDMCRINILVQWQTIINVLQTHQDACKQLVAESQTFKSHVDTLAGYLDNEQALLALLASVGLPDKIEANAFEKQVKEWQALGKKVAELQTQPSFESVKNLASESAGAISGAWQKLQEANAAQDRAAYEEARAKLPEAYDKLAAIDPLSKKQFKEHVSSLQAAYDRLFD